MGKALEGKIAVVTGGSSGIGLATAKRFASEGAFVFVTGRRKPELDAAVKAIGPNAFGVQADSSKLADLDHLFSTVALQKSRIDVLFVNAGGGEFVKLGDITEEHFDATFNTNVKGVVFTVQKALALMGEGGSIILNASTTATMGTEALSVYSATKAAVRNFARSWIIDLKGRGIRVNVLSPGPINTPGLNGLAGGGDSAKALLDGLATMVPLGRVGEADEIGKAAVFLASDASSFVNGAELFVDGGFAQI